jgi:hypothetical protein
LVVPDYNLVSGYDNKVLYFGKLADELIRNKRTQMFLLDTTYFVTVPNTQYNVYKNELLIVRSLLTDEYYKNIKPFNNNSFVQNVTYDNSDPNFYNDVNPYTNRVSINDFDSRNQNENENESESENENENENESVSDNKNVENENIDDEADNYKEFSTDNCVYEVSKVTGNAVAKWRFGRTFQAKEVHFLTDILCGFNLLSHIVRQEGKELPLDNVKYLKEVLCAGYNKHYDTYGKNIIRILKSQGKIELMNRMIKNKVHICEIVMSDDYYLSDLDIWIICEELKLPVILFTSGNIKSIRLKWLYMSPVVEDFQGKLHFIRTPSNNPSNLPLSYTLITPSMTHSEMRGDMRETLKTSLPDVANRMNVVDRLKTIYITENMK